MWYYIIKNRYKNIPGIYIYNGKMEEAEVPEQKYLLRKKRELFSET